MQATTPPPVGRLGAQHDHLRCGIRHAERLGDGLRERSLPDDVDQADRNVRVGGFMVVSVVSRLDRNLWRAHYPEVTRGPNTLSP